MTHVSTFMSWAQREEYVDRNPARGLALNRGPHARDLRHPFSEAQLRRIFSARDWRNAKGNDPALYFIPLLSQFGGLRITEACQLLTTDVRLQENIWIIRVEPGPGKKLKSRAAQRIVTVHPDLIRLGFIQYARSRPEGQLFDLPTDSLGLSDLLTNDASLDQVVQDVGGNITVIAVGTPGNRIVERLHTVQFDTLLAELRVRYDLVLFDMPPAVVAGEAMILANKVDAAVLVVRAYQEQRGLVARLINQLSDARCELLGILLNRPRGTAGGYLKKNYATMAEYSAQSST